MAEKQETMAKFIQKFPEGSRPESSLFEYPVPLLIQSGQSFQINKFNVKND